MSIFARKPEQRNLTVDPLVRAMANMRSARLSGSWAGVPVTPESVLAVPAVWACTQLTAGVISQLPLDEYRKRGDDRIELAPSQLLVAPSADVPLEDWTFQAIESAQLHGCAYGAIVSRDRAMWPTQIEILHPDRIQARINPQTRMAEWKVDGDPIASDDLWRMPGRPALGTPLGLPLLHYMAEVAGTGIAARRYGSDWFGEGGGAPNAIIAPATDPGQDGAELLKARVMSALRSRQPVVLPQSIEVKPWGGSTPQDAQLVDLLRNNSTDIAMFYLVPPELVGGVTGDSMTYSNVDARVLNLLVFGVSYWLNKLEKALTRSIPRDRYVKANEAAIIRTDIKTKTEVLVAQVGAGIIERNEARRHLDLKPLPGGDGLTGTSPGGTDATNDDLRG